MHDYRGYEPSSAASDYPDNFFFLLSVLAYLEKKKMKEVVLVQSYPVSKITKFMHTCNLLLTWYMYKPWYNRIFFAVFMNLTLIYTIECRTPSSSSNVLETVSGITTQSLSSETNAIVDELLRSLDSDMPTEM